MPPVGCPQPIKPPVVFIGIFPSRAVFPSATNCAPFPGSAKPNASVVSTPAIEKQSCTSAVASSSIEIPAFSIACFAAFFIAVSSVLSGGSLVIFLSTWAILITSTAWSFGIPHLSRPSSDVITIPEAASETFEQSRTLRLSTNALPFGLILSYKAPRSSTLFSYS